MKYILLALLMSGCTTSYQHMSDPTVANDGYDLLCGGVELGNKLTASVDLCKNVRGGNYIHAELKYRFKSTSVHHK